VRHQEGRRHLDIRDRPSVPLLALPDRLVIAREETYLRHGFGAAYGEFCARVHRWL
jgi:protein-S-isoprenylcysteine O-methyltransferase Ste14